MNNPIIVNFTAINRRGNDSYEATFRIETEKELVDAVQEFDKNCVFTKYDMETTAEHENGDTLTKEELQWFIDQDKKEDIGFIG